LPNLPVIKRNLESIFSFSCHLFLFSPCQPSWYPIDVMRISRISRIYREKQNLGSSCCTSCYCRAIFSAHQTRKFSWAPPCEFEVPRRNLRGVCTTDCPIQEIQQDRSSTTHCVEHGRKSVLFTADIGRDRLNAEELVCSHTEWRLLYTLDYHVFVAESVVGFLHKCPVIVTFQRNHQLFHVGQKIT
jgi:hypothetical protein